jgi:hypothetical protein
MSFAVRRRAGYWFSAASCRRDLSATVDRDQAEKTLQIIRDVIQSTHEDLVAHNWGLIWIVHSFTNGAAFAAIGVWAEANGRTLFWYLAPLAVVAVVNLLVIAVLIEKDSGVRSFVEWQVNGIWTTFILFSLAGAAMLSLAGQPKLFCPLMALNSDFGFAMMGVVFYHRFFYVAALYAVAAVACPWVGPVRQWFLLAALWWLAMIVPGIVLHREKLRRLADDSRSKIL